MDESHEPMAEPAETRCLECGTTLSEGQDREVTDNGSFCRPCFNNLTATLQQAVAEQGRDINYSMALVGGLAGAAAGVAVWWGFTVVTGIAFGLVAIVIGIAVGKGIVMLTGKRHRNLQILSTAISALAFFYATYLVNRTFIIRAYAEEGQQVELPLVPLDPELAYHVISAGFGIMDLVFLGIVVWQAWKIPEPVQLVSGPAG